MRKWRLPAFPTEDKWAAKDQVVVPKTCRQDILSIAHETPLAGHLSVNITCQKILNHFYWPNKRKDVAEYCHITPVRWLGNQIRPFQKHRYSHCQPFKNHLAESLLIVWGHYLIQGLETSIC